MAWQVAAARLFSGGSWPSGVVVGLLVGLPPLTLIVEQEHCLELGTIPGGVCGHVCRLMLLGLHNVGGGIRIRSSNSSCFAPERVAGGDLLIGGAIRFHNAGVDLSSCVVVQP